MTPSTAAVLVGRAAASIPLEDPPAVASWLDELQVAGPAIKSAC